MKVFLVLAALLWAVRLGWAAPEDAVVRIPSHGGSGTIIATGPGWTDILSCAHMLEGKMLAKPIVLDIPASIPGTAQQPGVKLVAYDYKADLSLIRVSIGPLPFVAPISQAVQLQRGNGLWSIGYDGMRGLPAAKEVAGFMSNEHGITYTAGKPKPGRSGGGLLTADGQLVGVCQGYELDGPQRGMYVNLQTIRVFLGKGRAGEVLPPPLRPPIVSDGHEPCPPGTCPPGRR